MTNLQIFITHSIVKIHEWITYKLILSKKKKKSLLQQFWYGVLITIQTKKKKGGAKIIPLTLLFLVQHFNHFWNLCYLFHSSILWMCLIIPELLSCRSKNRNPLFYMGDFVWSPLFPVSEGTKAWLPVSIHQFTFSSS